jgi:pSer/pThr/pTyr-binding forkhead associated (FHA) protein
MQAQLKVAKGSSSGKLFRIDGNQFIIGRATGCNLRPQSDAISRQHCAFIVKEDRLYVKDLGSRNGTHLNGQKLAKAAEVTDGDRVQVGPLYLEVIISSQSETPTQTGTDTVNQKVAATTGKQANKDGLIDWLMEDESKEDEVVATREFNLDSAVTTTITPKPEDEVEEAEKAAKKKKKKKEFGKLPTNSQDQKDTDTSRDAAADTLRQLYNRGT